jgi:CHAT domain-containing protein
VLAFFVQPGDAGKVRVGRHLTTTAEIVDALRRVRFQIGRALVGGQTGQRRPTDRTDRLSADARRALAALGDRLLGPFADEFDRVQYLAVVPHGPLHAVPFHALPCEGRFLVERLAVAQVPSASLLARLAGQPRGRVGGAGALVAGVADDQAPEIASEVGRVAATLPGARTLLGATATVAAVRAALPGTALVHLACHGRFSSDLPGVSGLKLADRWLTAREATDFRFDGAHVTLSGCDTGRALVTGGDELIGLPRALFAAGASSLLVSLWPVHDASAVELMTDFYRRWADGADPATAWRGAQLAALATRSHPAFWAPFVFGGLPWPS